MKTLKTLLQEITAGIKAWANASFSSGTHVHGNIANNGKLATASKVVISDSNKNITTSNVSDTELGYLSGVTSAIQTQISSKAYNADVVHNTGNETIAGTKTFASEIDGTASKAVADEDGNAINSTYGKLAGSQTWTGENAFSKAIKINGARTAYVVPERAATYSGLSLLTYDFNGALKIGTYTLDANNNPSLDTSAGYISVSTGVLNSVNTVRLEPKNATTADLGTSSYQWSSVYAQTYYYNGTAWGLDEANTWTNTNTFSADSYGELIRLKNTGLDLSNGNPALSSAYNHLIWWDDKNNAHYAKLQAWTNDNTSAIVLTSYYRVDANTVRTSSLKNYCNASSKMFFPESNADTELGTSTNKWKTINGINPGALGIPDKDNKVDISSEFTDLTGGNNYYIPPADGFVSINADTDIYCAVVSSTHITYFWRQSAVATSTGYASVTIPVRASLHLLAKINSTTAIYAEFFPCLGNV